MQYICDVLLTYIISKSYGIFYIFTSRTVYGMAVYMYFYGSIVSVCVSIHYVLMRDYALQKVSSETVYLKYCKKFCYYCLLF